MEEEYSLEVRDSMRSTFQFPRADRVRCEGFTNAHGVEKDPGRLEAMTMFMRKMFTLHMDRYLGKTYEPAFQQSLQEKEFRDVFE